MARVVLIFLLLTGSIAIGISAFRELTGKEKWRLTKLVAYGTMCAAIAFVILGLVVSIF